MAAKYSCKLTKKNVLKRLPVERQPLFDLGNLFILFLLVFWLVALRLKQNPSVIGLRLEQILCVLGLRLKQILCNLGLRLEQNAYICS
ncbi:MAG: hypothetical protein IJE12_03305 [Prevotella sp.]|nr:hypothetical protein [Prevotella sp.]